MDGTKNCLQEFLVKNVPSSIYYIPNFITSEEEDYLIRHVYDAPKPKWTQLSNRRLQNWGGLPHPKGMIPEKIPEWLSVYMSKVAALGAFEDKQPNHVLVNEYLPGQGIMPHEDGPLFYPTVSTISLGSHTLLDFYHHIGVGDVQCGDNRETECVKSFEDRHLTSVLLEQRSLILVKEDMYRIFLHGITDRTEDKITDKIANIDSCLVSQGDVLQRGTRISLTIRHIPKVIKVKLKLGAH